MTDFWLSCGHHLLDRDGGGGLLVTDEFLKVYLARPELAPPEDAGPVERTLHATLLAEPRRAVSRAEIAAVEDSDARENWEVMIAFRDHLLRHRTLEAAYLALVRQDTRGTPALFINQLVHLILRNALDGCTDAFVLRAAEILFREQRLTTHEGSLIAADEETISGIGDAPVSPLVSMLGLPAAAEIEVLNEANAQTYWGRSDRFDMAIDLTAGRRGLAALGEVIGRWVGHMLSTDVDVEALTEVNDTDLAWYVGLDVDGSRIGDMLWHGRDLDDATRNRVVGLFRLTFRDPQMMSEKVRGEPVYLILAMTPEMSLRMKPQNLIVGLPIRHLEAVS